MQDNSVPQERQAREDNLEVSRLVPDNIEYRVKPLLPQRAILSPLTATIRFPLSSSYEVIELNICYLNHH